MKLSFQESFYTLAFFALFIALLVVGKSILVPLGVALLLAFILYPVHKKLTKWGVGNILAGFLSILVMIIIISAGLTFFSAEIIALSDEISNFGSKLSSLYTDIIIYINTNVSLVDQLNEDELLNDLTSWLKDSAGTVLGGTFNSTASFLTGMITMFIYLFLFLIFNKGLVRAFMKFSPADKKEQFFTMLKGIQQVGQKYLSGMLTLILILGTLNSIGLWIIGIDSPFLFGFLAASLSIIPYIGTTLGAIIPVSYAFMSHDQLWVPLAVAILFWFVQLLEGNFLNPKIVGSSVNVNAFAAILSLIIGASVWGVAGMVLFLPFAAMLKVICKEYEVLQPIGLLIGNDNFERNKKNRKGFFKRLKDKVMRKN
ncbi:AI-2E family transporter [Psychroflexus sp. CAK57W]|uniref:AI-2E family transporter n=1 Tax=Psychroflexus curvus TaxID=2873595 RepID=UPI001CC9CD10|nr:AI-2E family transporter [Psychroflexus curvus]MBZ9626636.1 AI-2E family transporter [Psychroflexus curvus]MBZ9786402.1 AI-2E family transporter [Psychroflexus curvus]